MSTKTHLATSQYARAKDAAAYFKIARSTLWLWVKTLEGFPRPIKAGQRVTLFDLNAIDAFIKSRSGSAL